jgi:tetratricopeptide (TPR) repeat protein
MKRLILTSTIILAMLVSFAGDNGYTERMKKNLEALKAVNSPETFLEIGRDFKKIATEETEKWLPNYYVAYSILNYVFSDNYTSNLDTRLDEAQKYLDKARELSPDNSEIEALQGWIYQGRIQADPSGRGMAFSQKAAESFGKAKSLNPENPRTYFLNGMNVLYTPEQFGGGKKAACPYFQEAKSKYDSFKPESPIAPDWGKEYTEKLLEDCSK